VSRIHSTSEDALLERALSAARDTRRVSVRAGARHDAAAMFATLFGNSAAVIVADENTFAAAGRDVHDSFRPTAHGHCEPFIFRPDVYADDRCVQKLQAALEPLNAIPIAVGSGTINDLTKLVAHRLNRPYIVVATAAAMDGYTAFGASITSHGSKQTFGCPAPRAVLADLETIAAAPPAMNAAGYADLMAKVAAGADWMIADALGVEAIEPVVWESVQTFLRSWLETPRGIAQSDPECLRRLIYGLLMTGFAMQAAQSSRPASGAEHQFSHLWDMQHHTFRGAVPAHGFKVGIGTLASVALYEHLLAHDLSALDIDAAVATWPSLQTSEAWITASFGTEELADKAIDETRAKHLNPQALRNQLVRLRHAWPHLRAKLAQQLIPFREVQSMLREAGCPDQPEQIGISRDRLRSSYEQALYIRRRFTVLDLAHRTGLLEKALETMFAPGGPWS
jgi:glycerol-1-phosphate dehydrogenase [NAD(P)+]